MKSLGRKAEPSMNNALGAGPLKRCTDRLGRGAMVCATAAAMAFGVPLLENRALAQPPDQPAAEQTASPATARKIFTVNGVSTTITDGDQSRSVYILAKNLRPLLEINGPAKLTLKVYPVLDKARFAEGAQEAQLSIECASGPSGEVQATSHYAGKTSPSEVRHPDVDPAALVIGTPIRFTAEVGKGSQDFRLISPHGFLEIVSVEPVVPPVPRPKIVRKIPITIKPPPPPEKKEPEPVRPPAKQEPRMLFSMTGDRVHFSGFGPDKNSGDLNATEMLGRIPVTRSLSVLVGAYVTSYGLVLESPAAKSSFRSLSTDIMAGIGYRSGRHSLEALGLAGYRHLWAKLSATDGRSLTAEDRMAEYGGSLRYAYGPYFSMALLGTDNQFNPLMVRVAGSLPWGFPWVKGATPSLALTFNWLRSAVQSGPEGTIGGMELSNDAFDIIAVTDLPLLRLKMFTLSAIAGGELVLSRSGDVWGTGLFGGALSFEHSGLLISFRGMSSLEGAPFLALGLEYRR